MITCELFYFDIFTVFSLCLKTGIAIALYVLNTSVLPRELITNIGDMFAIGSKILSINLFKNKRIYDYTSGKFFNITFDLLTVRVMNNM